MTREQRRLAAVLAADVVAYSRLRGRDESGTVARLQRNYSERFDPLLAKYAGRLIKLTGEGALVEFASAVNALSAAIAFQQAMADFNRDQPPDTALVLRIGLHLADLIVEGDALVGDGMTIAAGLAGEASPGGIVISRSVHDVVAGRLKATFGDRRSLALKNIEGPVQAFEVKWDPADWQMPAAASTDPAPAADAPLPLPDKPSIAVLPFLNTSGDPEQEYFSDGLTDDIISELSRLGSLFVIDRTSSFFYKGKSADARQVGRDLGIRYLLEGSIGKSAKRIRVTGQLIETLSGNHIWSQSYDRALEDVFDLQQELTQAVVGAIAPSIAATLQSTASRRRPANFVAYDIALRSRAHALEGYEKADRPLIDRAIGEAKEALAIDPSCVPALHALARAHANALVSRMATDHEHALREATSAVARAIELDEADALGYALRGFFVLLTMQLDRYPAALADARHAHEMNPNDPIVLRLLAVLEAAMGEPEQAIEHLHRALRLSPRVAPPRVLQMLSRAVSGPN